MTEIDAKETARILLGRAGITPSEEDLARAAAFVGPPSPRNPKLATEPQLMQSAGEWEERR
jgi:hypothetical protein